VICMSKGQWTYFIILVIMIVVLVNAEGCAELILQKEYTIYRQKTSYYHTGYYLSEDLEQETNIAITLQ
jgi:hypothetical protein